MIPRIEIDSGLLGQPAVAPGGEIEQAAEGGNRAGSEARELFDFFAGSKAEAFDASLFADEFAGEAAVGGKDNQHKLLIRFADQRFRPASERCSPNRGRLLARKDRSVLEDAELNPLALQEAAQALKDGQSHKLFLGCMLHGSGQRQPDI
jgi:hypothetical protein